MPTWGKLFDRGNAVGAPVAAVREALERRRTGRAESGDSDAAADPPADTDADLPPTGTTAPASADPSDPDHDGADPAPDPSTGGNASPARVVADADVLAADLLAGGAARDALDPVRAHSWVDLVASDPLLADAAAVVRSLAADHDASLVDDWRERAGRERVPVEHPPGDHPGLASAYRGGAAHLLTFDEDLAGARTGLGIKPYVDLSVRPPDAFAAVFDAAGLYGAVVGEGEYPGPDRDPRG